MSCFLMLLRSPCKQMLTWQLNDCILELCYTVSQHVTLLLPTMFVSYFSRFDKKSDIECSKRQKYPMHQRHAHLMKYQCIHDVKTHSFLQRLSVVLTHNQVLLSPVAPVKSRIGPDPLTNRNWPVRVQQLPSSYEELGKEFGLTYVTHCLHC